MWEIQPSVKPNPPSLSQWLYQAVDLPGVRLRIRLRGNNLHILFEGTQIPVAEQIYPRILHALHHHIDGFNRFFSNAEDPVYKLVLYGRRVGQQRPAWIESIILADLDLPSTPHQTLSTPAASPTTGFHTTLLSNEHLARTGSPEPIARYLSESLSHLGVSVKVLVQKLPGTDGESAQPGLKRLWIICSCSYSPDASLIAEPIAQQLRDLELKGFKEAIIRSQVQGEANPDWVLQVDLTHPTELLWQWAKWGDAVAIARLLNQRLAAHHLDTRAIVEQQTVHVFCRPLPDDAIAPTVPPTQATVREVGHCLSTLLPQGITVAAIYGIPAQNFPATPPSSTELSTLQTAPAWVNWLPLNPSDETPATVQELARHRHNEALTFLLQRCLNPDIDGFLATGGIRVKLCFRGALLHVMTEAVVCPRQTLVVPAIESFLAQLAIPELSGVRIYGRRAGQSSPLWSHGTNQDSPDATTHQFSETTAQAIEPFTPALSVAELKTVSPWPQLRAMLARSLCLTSIFVPQPTSPWQPTTPSRWHTQQGWPAAIAWSLVGLVGMGLIDWQLNQRLQVQQSESSTADLSLNTDLSQPTTANPGARAAILAAARTTNPSFNNRLLDEKLALYQQHVQQWGAAPDILIVGSSRALRGIDPETLKQHVLKQHVPAALKADRDLTIFNFGVNGATAQVVELLLGQILTPDQLPKLILWADGARAFNSGRPDRTFEAIQESVGYTRLEAGQFPNQTPSKDTVVVDETSTVPFTELHKNVHRRYQGVNRTTSQLVNHLSFSHGQRPVLHDWLRSHLSTASLPFLLNISPDAEALDLSPQEAITAQGFLPLDRQFDPPTYYTQHPKVSGDYDTDYTAFTLTGRQLEATQNLLQYLQEQSIAVVFVNLPLTTDYLDATRQDYEQDFTDKMQAIAQDTPLVFRDLAQAWVNNYTAFSDPSHLNRYGAAQVSEQLAQDLDIPWQTLLQDQTD